MALYRKNLVMLDVDHFRPILEIGFRVNTKPYGCYIMKEGSVPKGKLYLIREKKEERIP